MVLKALILDVDGTLAETAEVRRAAYNRAFEEFRLGWFWTRAMYRTIQNGALPDREIEYFATNHSPVLFRTLKDENKIAGLRQFQEDTYLDFLDAGAAPLRPGAARLIADAVSSDIKLALCSLGNRTEIESLVFKHFGLEIMQALTCTVAREDLHTVSALSAYGLALQRLGCAPQNAIAIDDRGDGINAVAQLGMAAIAVPGDLTLGQNFDNAQLVLSDLGHPAAPFNVLKGRYFGAGHLTVDGLRTWHLTQVELAENAA